MYSRRRANTLTAGGTQERIFSTGGNSSSALGNNADVINYKFKLLLELINVRKEILAENIDIK